MKGWGVHIIGSGICLPGEPVSSAELQERWGLSFDVHMVESKIGIRHRHIAPDHLATSHLAAEAAREALAQAGITAAQLDRILLGTSTPDYTNTAASCAVQHLLGATCPVGDTNESCSSFLYALDQGIRLIATGAQYVCVIGADIKSRFVRRTDPTFAPLFGDGAGAVVLAKGNADSGCMHIRLFADGSGLQHIYVPAGGSAMPPSAETVRRELHGTVMTVSGKTMVDTAAQIMADNGLRALEACGMKPADVDLFIPHQANYLIMREAAERIGIPLEKMMSTIHQTGNTISATLPIAWHMARTSGRIQSGNKILFATAASGLTGGAMVYIEP